jgi:transcriptional regulator with XRE-family HTH domain
MAIDQRLLGKAIRRVRQLRGMTQAELAEAAGLRGNSVALIERSQRGVSMGTLNDLADALEIPAACLTMLGTSKFSALRGSARLVSSMRKLILATITAEEKLLAQESAKVARQTGGKKKKRAKKTAPKKRRGRSALRTA